MSCNPNTKETTMTDGVIPIAGEWSHYPRTEPPELAGAKHRATNADRKRFSKRLHVLEVKIRKGLAKLQGRVHDLKDREADVQEVETKINVIRERAARRFQFGRRGETGRTVPTWLYVPACIGFYIVTAMVDRGALLALGLSVGLTTAFAFAVPAVELLCAHTVGGYFWRRHEAISTDVDVSDGEHGFGLASLGLGVAHGIAVGFIRGLRSGLLAGVLFCAVALALFAGMAYLAFRHADDDAAALGRARLSRWWRLRRRTDAVGRVHKTGAVVRSCCQQRIGLAAERVARWEASVAAGAYAFEQRKPNDAYFQAPDPEWIAQEREIAAGHLPDHLLPFDARSWVEGTGGQDTSSLPELRRPA
jgi:hypothetical protein